MNVDGELALIPGTYDVYVGGFGPAPQGVHVNLESNLQPAHATLVVSNQT